MLPFSPISSMVSRPTHRQFATSGGCSPREWPSWGSNDRQHPLWAWVARALSPERLSYGSGRPLTCSMHPSSNSAPRRNDSIRQSLRAHTRIHSIGHARVGILIAGALGGSHPKVRYSPMGVHASLLFAYPGLRDSRLPITEEVVTFLKATELKTKRTSVRRLGRIELRKDGWKVASERSLTTSSR